MGLGSRAGRDRGGPRAWRCVRPKRGRAQTAAATARELDARGTRITEAADSRGRGRARKEAEGAGGTRARPRVALVPPAPSASFRARPPPRESEAEGAGG